MKARIQFLLQRILGLKTYLKIFSWYKIKTLHNDTGENDFFHFLQLIPKGSNVLDIGANIGIMAYYLSKRVSTGTVHAFEPMPQNLSALRWVIRRFKLDNIKVSDLALGNETGSIQMVMPVVENVKKQGLSHVLSDDIKEFNEGDTFTTSIAKLDDLAEIKDTAISAIKIDVENFEYHVFLGAEQVLRKNRPIIYCELWDNENRYKCFDFMKQLNYSIKFKQGDGLIHFDEDNHTTQNFFFIPE
ncbi:MAG: FkbM family methyltransferase [Bacteroidia bacterium]